jgi:hypothetical protein
MNRRMVPTTLAAAALAAMLSAPAADAQQPPPAPGYVLSVEGLYPNVAEAGNRRLALMVAYGVDGRGGPMRRLAIIDVTPGTAPRGIQRVFEAGRTRVTIGGHTYDLAMEEFFNEERNRSDLEVTLTAIEKIGGVEQPVAVVKTDLSELSEVRARQAREANLEVKLGDESFWVTPGFFGDQSGFLFFDDATIKRLDVPAFDALALEPRFIVMTTERRGVFSERLADSVPVGATGYVVAWDHARFAWVAKRAAH